MTQYKLLNKTALDQILQSEHALINQIMRKTKEIKSFPNLQQKQLEAALLKAIGYASTARQKKNRNGSLVFKPHADLLASMVLTTCPVKQCGHHVAAALDLLFCPL